MDTNKKSQLIVVINSTKVLSLVLGIISWATLSIAQSAQVPKIEDLVKIPPSPEAAAFAKYGNTPVNLYSGTPEISIPIGSVQGREINVPISLSYDASGIKVEQLATWAGLGWNLNVGGMVTRQVNGLPDDFIYASPTYHPFYKSSIFSDYQFAKNFWPAEGSTYPAADLTRYFQFMQQVTNPNGNEQYELQPDTYSFSVMGLSGTLVVDYTTGTGFCVEQPDLKVTPIIFEDAWSKQIAGWELIDAAGNTYSFLQAEKTRVYTNDYSDGERVYNSAWALTTLTTANARDVVQFTYTVLPEWSQEQLAGRTDTYQEVQSATCGTDGLAVSISPTYKISQLELNAIQVNGIPAAQIVAGPARNDLIGKNSLGGIRLFDTNGQITRQYQLRHSYFGTGTDEKMLRLRLDSIEIFGSTLVNAQKYRFTYFDGLPSRESKAQDFWGYYNGMNINTTLIPYHYQYDKDNPNFQGAKRVPNFSFAKAGTLNKIKYPTGGTTEFIYEGHRLPENAYSFEEEYQVSSVSLTGGQDPSNPFNYCDDVTSLDPKGIESAFQITQSGTYQIKLRATNTNPGANPANHLYYVAIYSSGPGNTISQNFCQIFNGAPTQLVETGGFTTGFSNNYSLSLAPGFYRILILNTMPSVTIQAEVFGVTTVNAANSSGAGLRIQKIIDKDIDGSIQSRRYFYYHDLSTVAPASITESFVSTSTAATAGTLHPSLDFMEAKSYERQHPDQQTQVIDCSTMYRYSNNRSQSHYFITYAAVSEIAFDGTGNHEGYTVTNFHNVQESWTNLGFSKVNPNNGKVTARRVYDKLGTLLTRENNFYSQVEAGPGMVGYYFTPVRGTMKCLFVKSPLQTPSQAFYTQELGPFVNSGGSWLPQGCSVTVFASHATSIFSTLSQAQTYYNQLVASNAPDPFPPYDNSNSSTPGFIVGYRLYNIVFKHPFGQEYQKSNYLMPQYWLRHDSTVTVQYANGNQFMTYTRNLYENANHYQITGTRQVNSQGKVVTSKFYYPNEMLAAFPANPIWQELITRHRLSEQVKVESYLNQSQLSAVNTIYKTVGTKILPDKKQFSLNQSPLEDRILFTQYDAVGNMTELRQSDNTFISVVYGYNNSLPVAQIQNAQKHQVYYNSFEEGAYDFNDGFSGSRSKNGFSHTLTGLSPGNYTLSYVQKSGGTWIINQSQVNVSGTSYSINISGQVDEVRFHPVFAQMTTYSYQPGVGMTSMVDANGKITRYQYDTFGRLEVVRDNQNNILSQQAYNYVK